MSHHVFGVRHHGPGSARSLARALEALEPDAVLVEGPPDADAVIPLAARDGMQPPVAVLVHLANDPREAAFWPFAAFSPEWLAIRHALAREVPVRFMDLSAGHWLGQPAERGGRRRRREDPLDELGRAAGFGDGERFWNHVVEQRRGADDEVFAAVAEAMGELRRDEPEPGPHEQRREAAMRQAIRAARRAGHERIAVVCGAWHAPALLELGPASRDAALLRGLPRGRTQATWVPWTYGRLLWASGYGAGVESPGWYEHLFTVEDAVAERWLARVARLLRSEGLDASPAQVVDAVRLAEALAALREQPLAGLPELDAAAEAVLALGDPLPLRLVHDRLVVGERLGGVPDDVPVVPLQRDLERQQRRLRLPAEADERQLELDLRKPNDLARSHLLHRLRLLGIPWGARGEAVGALGTFREPWTLRWEPDFAVALVEAARFGNTVRDAADARARGRADEAEALPALTALVAATLLADLPDAVAHAMARLDERAALATDLSHLADAVPPLARVLRYGSVRRTDAGAVAHVVEALLARVAAGLPPAASGIDEDAAAALAARMLAVHDAVALLPQAPHAAWWDALGRLARGGPVHPLLAGAATRLLLDAEHLAQPEVAARMALALAPGAEPRPAADWLEGFLGRSGALVVHDPELFGLLDAWIDALRDEGFDVVLPALRRAFSAFPAAERRAIGERARRRGAPAARPQEVDAARGDVVLDTLALILGEAR